MAKWNNSDAGKFSSRLKDGNAEYIVIKSEDKVSEKGNPMTKLTLQVDQGPIKETIWHYILDGDAKTFKYFLESAGRPEWILRQDIPADEFRNLQGNVIIEVKADIEGNNRKSKVKRWVKAVDFEGKSKHGKLDDELPF